MRARWKLGRLLAGMERQQQGGRPGKNCPGAGQFRAYLREIGLDKNRALEAQRIGTLPTQEFGPMGPFCRRIGERFTNLQP
jgi:hypothetical protein